MRGIPRQAVRDRLPVAGTAFTADQVADTGSVCDWNTDNFGLDHGHPGAQAYYDSQLALFAEWGVDFVKADDMLGPYFTVGDRRLPGRHRQIRAGHGPQPLARTGVVPRSP